MTRLERLEQRMARMEQQVRGQKEFEGEVVSVDDPEGLNRVKVKCFAIWGTDESPWIMNRAGVGGDSVGEVWTPVVGDLVSVRLRDGNPDSAEWQGGHRSSRSKPPSEFSDPQVNGFKTPSGIIVTYDDRDGSYTVENAEGGKAKIMPDGSVELWGTKFITHMPSELNDGEYGITSEYDICPFSGLKHTGSSTCKVKAP